MTTTETSAVGARVRTDGSAIIDLPEVRELKTFLEEEFKRLTVAISEETNVKELKTFLAEEFRRMPAAISEEI